MGKGRDRLCDAVYALTSSALLAGGWLVRGGRGLAAAAAALLAFYAAVGLYLFLFASRRGRNQSYFDAQPDLRRAPPQVKADCLAWEAERAAEFRALGAEELSIVSADGLTLRGMLVPGDRSDRRVMVLAHGYRGRAMTMAGYAQCYLKKGMAVLLADARGHGRSGGRYIGWGWPERLDYLKWFDLLIEKYGPDVRIAMHGVSMGAATAMMVSGEALPSQVKFFVEDCGYTSLFEELRYQLRRRYHMPPFPALYAAALYSRCFAGVGFRQASALRQVAKNRRPMVFIHGDADRVVPCDMAWALYRAAGGPRQLFIVPGAGHAWAMQRDATGAIERAIDGLIEREMR
ncbi:MAG: alpha/beta fold hydrolase [Clostridiales bacterium]|nr:alpha/beta fold hydrolase [Clostridiales bacterium]